MGRDVDAQQQWAAGYEAARTYCLTRGAVQARHLRPDAPNAAYEAGYDWGVWDYEDANGLPHAREQGA
ncbi:hypothetical protein [Solicola sp. PLA-1-18]|uniref:hypothetical protein n=1 Tax=Solicola sp. PLA-1-18 TaxID=3380532 RepID=UPI003B7A9595